MKRIRPLYLIVAPFLFALSSVCTYAQTYADDYWLDWEESKITTFPDFDVQNAIPIEVNSHSQMDWRVDPKTITLDKDSVVRYVVMAVSNTGTINAMYEGILCAQDSYKIYARSIGNINQAKIEWRPIENPQWQNLRDAQAFTHERMLARNYMCDGSARANSVYDIIKKLRNPYTNIGH